MSASSNNEQRTKPCGLDIDFSKLVIQEGVEYDLVIKATKEVDGVEYSATQVVKVNILARPNAGSIVVSGWLVTLVDTLLHLYLVLCKTEQLQNLTGPYIMYFKNYQ